MLSRTKRRMRLGDWLALTGVLLTILALLLAWLSLREDRTANQRAAAPAIAKLRVVGTPKVQLRRNLKAEIADDTGEAPSAATLSSSMIDVVLENTGDRPALLTGVDVTVNRVIEFPNCLGGGSLVITGAYDVKVPFDAAKRRMPLRLRDERPFTVAPHAFDRLAVTVGPNQFGEANWPSIYHITVAIREQAGSSINVGRFVLAEPVQDEVIFGTIDAEEAGAVYDKKCVRNNAVRATQELRAGGIPSPTLTGLINGLRKRGFA